jgi:hypothetical protein
MPRPVRLVNIDGVTSNIVSISTASATDIAVEVNPGVPFTLERVDLKLESAPTDSNTFSVTVDRGDGATYDTVIFSEDLTASAITSMSIPFGEPYTYEADDHLDIAWTNTDSLVYGLTVVYKRV